MQRRQFLSLATFGILGTVLATDKVFSLAEPKSRQQLYSASDNAANQHFISRFYLDSGALQQLPVPMRGHATLALNDSSALLFGRRPAYECVRVNFNTAEVDIFKANKDRHFNGHGCLSADKKLLLTTETDYEKKRGVIGIRDLATLKPIGEYESYGLDPHDLQLLPDGKTLVVANGGIETHPDFERRKLNIPTMQPSLVYVDLSTGKKLAEYRLPDHLLSIRHITVTAQGDVAVALQYEGDLYKQQPRSLVAWQAAGGELKLLDIAAEEVGQLRGYLADIIYDPKQQLLVSATPRGHCVSLWSTETASFVAALPLPEASGASLGIRANTFLISSSQGGLYELNTSQGIRAASLKPIKEFSNLAWDNHLQLLA